MRRCRVSGVSTRIGGVCCRSGSSPRAKRATTSTRSRTAPRSTTSALAKSPATGSAAGAAQLGLDGVVSDDAFVALLKGVNPLDGSALGRPNRRVPALDLTFSAPKSVSVAWALGGADAAREIVAAHEEALASALRYLEREAVFVRRGHNGAERLIGGGLVGAAFRHRTSRAGDPQLHTHVVVANAAQGPDGRWSALDARHLYGQARTAGFLYQAELRAGLTARLDVGWEQTVKGTGDLTAVPVDVRREFSRRRAQIEAELGPDSTPREACAATVAHPSRQDPDRRRLVDASTSGSTAPARSDSRRRCCMRNWPLKRARPADCPTLPGRLSRRSVPSSPSTVRRSIVVTSSKPSPAAPTPARPSPSSRPRRTGCSPGPTSSRSASAGSGSATRPPISSRSKTGYSTKPKTRGDDKRGVVPDPEVNAARPPGAFR